MGEQDVPLNQVAIKLGEVAARHRAILDRWSVFDMADPATAALTAAARAAINAGQYDEANALLLRAGEQEMVAARQAEQLARDAQQSAGRRWLRAAEADSKRGDLAMTRLRYKEAAQHYATAAGVLLSTHQGESRIYLNYLWLEADALHSQGREQGDNKAAALAITRSRHLASKIDRTAAPLDWAATQSKLGDALQALGERERGSARLEEAVVAHRAALEERMRERVPLDWAATQDNLGNALLALGHRESGTARLEEAMVAHRVALEERTRGRVPLAWATTQHNLGLTLWAIGERETGTARLEEAVAAWQESLTIIASEWPQSRVQQMRSSVEQTKTEIARRSYPR